MGTDKALVRIEGATMISRMAESLSKAGLEPIRISVSSAEDVESYGSTIEVGASIEWVLDSKPHSGPIDAIADAILDPQLQGTETLQISPVDYPWLSPDLFRALEDGLGKSDSLIMPHDGDRAHPLLALVRVEAMRVMLGTGDRRPLHRQFVEVPHSILLEDPTLLRNVNSPKDLE